MYFTVDNFFLLQSFSITMRIDLANPIRTNKLRGRWFHSTFRFTDGLCALNDGGELGKVFLETYPKELGLKVEHNGSHATFLDLNISVDKGKFIYAMFE